MDQLEISDKPKPKQNRIVIEDSDFQSLEEDDGSKSRKQSADSQLSKSLENELDQDVSNENDGDHFKEDYLEVSSRSYSSISDPSIDPESSINEDYLSEEEELLKLCQKIKNKDQRYFQLSQRRCRQCKKIGHTKYDCPRKTEMICRFCLGPHKKIDCNSQVCFKCGLVGHIAKSCPVKQKIEKCNACNRVIIFSISIKSRMDIPVKIADFFILK